MARERYATQMKIPKAGRAWLEREAARYHSQMMSVLCFLLVSEWEQRGSLEGIEDLDNPGDTVLDIKIPMSLVQQIGGPEVARAAIRHILTRNASPTAPAPRIKSPKCLIAA